MAPKDKQAQATPEGERIAKLLSRRGIASRREAERLIEMGEVSVNGKVIASPALNVTDADRIVVSGKPLPQAEPTRLWLYYKPEGLVTSASDEKGRDTVFDHLPEDMPRVMSVGRLDLNSEGLLLLTNDGELKRRLELPSTGWLRKYRVRVNGEVNDPKLQPLRDGITIEGERFKPMQVTIDRQQGANAWLTVGLREGRNREIRRAMSAVGLYVNRLIRVSYGPFRLGELEPGQVEEIKARVLRDQLGETGSDDGPDTGPAPRAAARSPARKPAAKPATKPGSRAVTKSGAGVEALSAAWKEATTPRPGPRVKPRTGTGAAASGAAKPATTSRTAPRSRPDEALPPRGGAAVRTAGKTASPARAPRLAAKAKQDEAPSPRGGKPATSARRAAAPAAKRAAPAATARSGPGTATPPEAARGKPARSAAALKGKAAAKPAGKTASGRTGSGKPATGDGGVKPAPSRAPQGGKLKRPPRSRG
ncbi:pseudouridine synthase [Pseudogemmobacter humi]|uniref:Pseudouridine synthase n=1 Tax=Pseudogemmobacter humi TaxID=2483812 RepID=A0A3P5XR37_9RHOB|nr:pseudouridine synthase [Pseudogemmobacter humi]VDC31355.1 Ribosomal large subunit pseudouridine synthase B [Pseudogemmobacter humi]